MEPLTTATALASVLSLIGQFRAERGAENKQDTEEFMSWLHENRHDEIIQLLELNAKTATSIKALLAINHDELVSRLETIDKALALYASRIPEFSDLADVLRPNNKLSDQAISILKQLNDSGGSKLLEAHMGGVIILQVLNGNGGKVVADDERFLEDDLKTLVEFDLLRHDVNSKGNNLYLLTRGASEYVASL